MKGIEIASSRDRRNAECLLELGYSHAPLPLQKVSDFAAPLLRQESAWLFS
jgi:hypothetical protein